MAEARDAGLSRCTGCLLNLLSLYVDLLRLRSAHLDSNFPSLLLVRQFLLKQSDLLPERFLGHHVCRVSCLQVIHLRGQILDLLVELNDLTFQVLNLFFEPLILLYL